MRLIDGDALFDKVYEAFGDDIDGGMANLFMGWINEAPTLTPPNEPLTLDELRKMDGAPVWVVPIGKCKWATRQWCVLAADEVLIPGVDHWWWSFEDYGETWIAYRRPPEGEEDT